MEAMRNNGVLAVEDIMLAILETNGTLSVLLKAQYQNSTKQDIKVKTKNDGYTCPVIIDGAIVKKNLEVKQITFSWNYLERLIKEGGFGLGFGT